MKKITVFPIISSKNHSRTSFPNTIPKYKHSKHATKCLNIRINWDHIGWLVRASIFYSLTLRQWSTIVQWSFIKNYTSNGAHSSWWSLLLLQHFDYYVRMFSDNSIIFIVQCLSIAMDIGVYEWARDRLIVMFAIQTCSFICVLWFFLLNLIIFHWYFMSITDTNHRFRRHYFSNYSKFHVIQHLFCHNRFELIWFDLKYNNFSVTILATVFWIDGE